ncbi:unnamed protein product, partial [Candidula unifasciata]
DLDTSNPSFRRPRGHEHGVKDPKLSQMPDFGSLHNLAHSGPHDAANHSKDVISRGHRHSSHTDNVDGASNFPNDCSNMEGALAALPGPGKLKQLTKQRAADDADSGFIGSMVGSGVGLDPGQLQQQRQQMQQQQQSPQQPEERMRLRLTKAVDE